MCRRIQAESRDSRRVAWFALCRMAALEYVSETEINQVRPVGSAVEHARLQAAVFGRKQNVRAHLVDEIDKRTEISGIGIRIVKIRAEATKFARERTIQSNRAVDFKICPGLEFQLCPASHCIESSEGCGRIGKIAGQ